MAKNSRTRTFPSSATTSRPSSGPPSRTGRSVDLFKKRGVKLERTYQLNTGGNTDFLNMLNRTRLASKKTSKTEAVQSVTAERLDKRNIHIGPSDYVPWQNDQKICFYAWKQVVRRRAHEHRAALVRGRFAQFGRRRIDSIRCCKLALNRGIGGVLYSPSAYFSKHRQHSFPMTKRIG